MMTESDIWNARIRGALGSLAFVIVTALVLFIPAGTLDWPGAWALLAIHAGVLGVILFTISPGLLEERSKPHADSKPWDRFLVTALFLIGYLVFIVAGLDFRYGWTGPLPPCIPVIALVLVILGNAIMAWASAANQYFSAIVRIQTDRGQAVVWDGPYRFVRHPGYAGMIMYVIFQPLLLGSVWALVPAFFAVALFVIRTQMEDRTLEAELPGYREYVSKVKYRLVPGMW